MQSKAPPVHSDQSESRLTRSFCKDLSKYVDQHGHPVHSVAVCGSMYQPSGLPDRIIFGLDGVTRFTEFKSFNAAQVGLQRFISAGDAAALDRSSLRQYGLRANQIESLERVLHQSVRVYPRTTTTEACVCVVGSDDSMWCTLKLEWDGYSNRLRVVALGRLECLVYLSGSGSPRTKQTA